MGFNGIGREFTPEEDARLEELRCAYRGEQRDAKGRIVAQPSSLADIARKLGHSKGAVYDRLCLLARRGE